MRLIQFSEHPSESEQSHTITSSARTLRLGRLVYTFLGMISNRYELVVQDDVRVVVVVVVVFAFVVETGSQEDLSARVGAWPRSFPGPANTRPGGGFVSVVIVICDPLGLRLGSARPPKKTENVFFLSLSLFPGREERRPPLAMAALGDAHSASACAPPPPLPSRRGRSIHPRRRRRGCRIYWPKIQFGMLVVYAITSVFYTRHSGAVEACSKYTSYVPSTNLVAAL